MGGLYEPLCILLTTTIYTLISFLQGGIISPSPNKQPGSYQLRVQTLTPGLFASKDCGNYQGQPDLGKVRLRAAGPLECWLDLASSLALGAMPSRMGLTRVVQRELAK